MRHRPCSGHQASYPDKPVAASPTSTGRLTMSDHEGRAECARSRRSVCRLLFGGGPAVAPRSGHYGRMGLLCDYFTAASNAQAAETIDWIGGPANPPRTGLARRNQIAARPTVSLPGIEPTTWMGKPEEILTGVRSMTSCRIPLARSLPHETAANG